MLAVSSQAASAIDDILAARGELPEQAGVRITRRVGESEDGAAEQTLGLQVVEAPEAGDEVLEEAPVFLEPEAAALLDDKVLDADISGERVHFAVRERS